MSASDKPQRPGKLGGVLNALKRVSFTRRASSESFKEKEQSSAAAAPPSTNRNTLSRTRSASSLAPSNAPSSSQEVASIRPTLLRLNSASPASELPKTWAEWTQAYRQGLIDFNDPPEPPSDLHSTEHATPGGVFPAPLPEGETARQRAVDSIALLHKKKAPTQNLETTTSTLPDGTGPALDSEEKTELQAEENERFDPTELPTYSVLEELAKQAQDRFGVETASVSLMDRDQQLFLAKRGFLPPREVTIVDRQETCCSHTILKACSTGEKDPFVVLDFAKDWRFQTNSFGDHSEGFYAAAPVLLPSALGEEGNQAAGVFCILGRDPRSTFSDEDRMDLEEMADQASKEIQKWADQNRKDKKAELAKKRKDYKKELARSASQRNNLDTVDEMPTPPATPDLNGLEMEEEEPIRDGDINYSRRPSLAESANSEKSLDLKTTSTTPAFPKRRGRQGVRAQPAVRLGEDLQAVIDLSTQLVAESIEMDFAYVIAIDMAAAAEPYDPERESPLRFVAVHGMPIPAPQFSVDLHLETLTSPQNALLYVNNDYTGISGEFSTGLLVKIGVKGNTGYILGTFTEDQRRVLNQEDLLFLRSFSRDIGRQLVPTPSSN